MKTVNSSQMSTKDTAMIKSNISKGISLDASTTALTKGIARHVIYGKPDTKIKHESLLHGDTLQSVCVCIGGGGGGATRSLDYY